MATITAKVGAAGNWADGSSWIGGVAPTAADDAVIPLATTSIVINTGSVCRSADFNTFTGTVTHNTAVIFSIGDGTAGAGNIALRMGTGMTYNTNTSSSIAFISTSGTQQTITTAGVNMRNLSFTGVGSSYILSDALTATAGGSATALTHQKGTLNTNNQTVVVGIFNTSATDARTLTLGTSSITCQQTSAAAWTAATSTNLTLSAASSTITLSGASATFSPGTSQTYGTVIFTGGGTSTISSGGTISVLTVTGTAVKTDSVIFGSTTISTTLNLNGNSSTNRLLVRSATLGAAITITSASNSITNADFRDITGAGAGSWDLSAITGGSGDCGGNTNITFTTAATQTATGSTSNSSTATWSGRVPLPQDDVVLSLTAGQTLVNDMPRIGKNISVTTEMNLSVNTVAQTIYGSLDLTNVQTFTSGSTGSWTFEGRGSHTLKSNGKNLAVITLSMFGGTLALEDACSAMSTSITHNNGTFIDNGVTLTALGWTSNNSNIRTVTKTGIWNISGSGNRWTVAATNLTWSDTGTINMNNASSGTFAGGGLTYNIVDFRTASIVNTITGANTFGRLMADNAATAIVLPGSTTTTILSGAGLGNGTNVITFTASAGSATVAKSGGGTVGWDYVHLTNIIASTANTWYAGTHSTDNGGNTNWIFTAVPSDYYSGSINDFKQAWYSSRGYTRTLNDNELAYFNTENSTTFISIRDAKSRFFLNLGYSGTLGDMYYKSLLTTLGLSASSFSVTDAERIFYSNTSNEFV